MIIRSGFASSATCCGVTPQAQKTGMTSFIILWSVTYGVLEIDVRYQARFERLARSPETRVRSGGSSGSLFFMLQYFDSASQKPEKALPFYREVVPGRRLARFVVDAGQ